MESRLERGIEAATRLWRGFAVLLKAWCFNPQVKRDEGKRMA